MHTISVEDANLFYLLFADDLTLFSNTVIGLQRLIDRLSDYCNQWKLTVNIDKTKIMVFRRGGPLSRTEKWFYNGSQIETVSYFKYLGVTFSSSGNWSRNNVTMGERGLRALNYIRSINIKLTSLPVNALCTMFDSMVIPAMTYGGEIWGFGECTGIERVQVKFGKLLLGLPDSVPNCVPGIELGRSDIKCILLQKAITYWIKLKAMDSSRYPFKCYQLQLRWVQQERDCWALKIKKKLLYGIGMGEVWLFGAGNTNIFLKHFKQRISNIKNQEMLGKVQETSMLRIYKLIKTNFGEEPYIRKAKTVCIRKSLAKLRGSGLYINVHIGRRQNIPYEERVCVNCSKCIEDEYHVLFECPLYNNIRNRFIPRYYTFHPNQHKMVNLMTTESEIILNNLGKFVMYMQRIRDEYLDWTSI